MDWLDPEKVELVPEDGWVLLPVTVGLMLLVWGRDTGTVGLFSAVVMVVQLAVLLLSVAVVENALKRTFGR